MKNKSNKIKNKITLNDLAMMVKHGFDSVDNKFTKVEKRLDNMAGKLGNVENRLDNVENKLGNVENRLDNVENKLTEVENNIVTKDYLDKKIGELKGENVITIKKLNTKTNTLTNILYNKKIISHRENERVLNIEPYSR